MGRSLQHAMEHAPAAGGRPWKMQVHWQYDVHAINAAILAGGSTLSDSTKSGLHATLLASIRRGFFKHVNLLEIDDVCHIGSFLVSALREWQEQA